MVFLWKGMGYIYIFFNFSTSYPRFKVFFNLETVILADISPLLVSSILNKNCGPTGLFIVESALSLSS